MKERNDYYVVKKEGCAGSPSESGGSQASAGFGKGNDCSGSYREGRHQPEFILQV